MTDTPAPTRPVVNPPNPKERFGIEKDCIQFVPASAILEEAKVMKLGANKYGPYNWRIDKVLFSTYYSAAFRHLAAAYEGEDIDEESKAMHLAHVRACCGILIDAMKLNALIDDRPDTLEGLNTAKAHLK